MLPKKFSFRPMKTENEDKKEAEITRKSVVYF